MSAADIIARVLVALGVLLVIALIVLPMCIGAKGER